MATIRALTPAEVEQYLDGLVELLQDAVAGGAAVSFLAPVAQETAQAFWRRGAAQIAEGSLYLLAALEGERVAGCVQLALAGQVNATHRAEIQKLMVHRDFRRRGLATSLLRTIEARARALDRWLVVLDTEQGSPAEPFYAQQGYQRVGAIPDFALSSNGSYHATVIFYKQLQRN